MSVKVMGKVWDMTLPPNEKFVLLALADHADHDGYNAHPGNHLLAKKTGLSLRQVQRILDKLEQDNLIEKITGGVGRGQVSSYGVLTKKGDTVTPFKDKIKDDKVSPIKKKKGDIGDIKKVTSETLKGDIGDNSHDIERARFLNHHEPSIEPSITGSKDPAEKPYDFYKVFADGYERHYGLPYKPSRENREADFGQIKRLIYQYGEKLSLIDWADLAVVNYFATPQASHTAKDLATRYAIFRRTPLNEFGKPVKPAGIPAENTSISSLSKIGQQNAATTRHWLERKFGNGQT